MKVLLLTPAPAETWRGGAATVRRYRDGLQRRGHLCEMVGSSDEGALKQSLEGTLGRFRPDIVHAHDAARTAIDLLGLRLPWVVSVSGEDVHREMTQEGHGPLVCEALRHAHRVLVPSADTQRMLESRVPELVGKIDVVPRSAIRLPTEGTDLRRSLGIPRSRFLVLLPGGLRPTKAQHRALGLPAALRSAGVESELIVVGPEQDADYARELAMRAQAQSGVRILPALSYERMGAAYRDADVVLNTSLCEGSSPTILEAGLLGRPVVASRVAGNRDLVRHKETGLLFDDEDEMVRHILVLARNRSVAGALGVRMREDFCRRFDPDREVDLLLSSYAAA